MGRVAESKPPSMFPNQTFHPPDIGVVAFLVLLEGLLSADNALVLAIMVRHLPKAEQQKALLYGLGGAFLFRGIAILFAATLIKLWWLQAIGAAYLLILPIKHFVAHRQGGDAKPVGAGFWRTVIAVEVADIAFAIDSVLVGVSTVGFRPDKIWVVYVGAIVGVVLLRFAAAAFIRLLEKYPALDHLAYVIVGWVGVKLSFMAGHNFVQDRNKTNPSSPLPFSIPEMPTPIFWGVLGLIVLIGGYLAFKNPREAGPSLDHVADRADDASDLKIDHPA